MITRLLLALALFAAIAASATAAPAPGKPATNGATPAYTGAPRFVQLTSVEGLPADSSVRRDFIEGFRGAFAEPDFPSQKRLGDETWGANLNVPNRFKLLEGFPADDAWTLQVVIGAPPPAGQPPRQHPRPGDPKRRMLVSRRASRGMIAVFTALSPEAIRNGARALPERIAFAFPSPPPADPSTQAVVSSGFEYSWSEAGRVAGLLALETLHHHSGDLNANERLVIEPAVRSEAGR